MIKCPNCDRENPDGSKFCSTCGKKLEIYATCSSCGGQVAYGAVFCPQCGKKLSGGGSDMLSESVIAGDVSVDTSTKIDTSTNYNNSIVNIYNQSITETAIKCHACGKALPKGEGAAYKCAKCGETFCSEHFISELKLCNNCSDEANRLLRSRMYDEARTFYESSIASGATEPDVYYYAAICLLKGKTAFVQQRATIDKIVYYLNSALAVEEKAIYYYFLSYIKYDYFENKYLRVNPDYRTSYRLAVLKGISESEIREMYSLMGVARPSCL